MSATPHAAHVASMNSPFWKDLTKQDDLETQYEVLCKRETFTSKEIAMNLARFAEARIFNAAGRRISELEEQIAATGATVMTTPTAHSRGAATPLSDEQIDATLASRVMQWGGSSANGMLCWSVPTSPGYSQVIPQSRWRPSTYIADAWRVMEKFKPPKYIFRVCSSVDGRWWCEIALLETDDGTTTFTSYREVADTAPKAICLAALKAVGVQA